MTQLLLPASIPQNPLGQTWQRLNHLGAAVDVLSAARAMCWCISVLCQVLVQRWVRRLGKGRFCNHIALRMNVWQEAWPERNCFLDRIIHGQTALARGESSLELRSSRGEGTDEFGRGQF